MKNGENTMVKYNCPKCGAPAPETGGVYYKSYDPEENKAVYFWFPTYMCEKCELEFVINGARIVDGKLVWQDEKVRREDWDDSGWV
jgi:DNA-directed RNA polymerase subunit RPC12/RpoP